MSNDEKDPPPGGAEPPSFDPRTWRAGPLKAASPAGGPTSPPPAPPAAPNVDTSFDPKTWAAGLPARERSAAQEPPPSRRGLIVGAGGGAVVLAAGGGAAWWLTHRPPSPPAQPPRKTGPRPAVPQPKGPPGSSVNLTAESLLMLQQQLPAYQATEADAKAAVDALGKAFGGGEGRMEVRVQFSGGAAGRIEWLEARRNDGVGVRLERAGDGFTASALDSNLTARLCGTGWGVMNEQSFYSSATSMMEDVLIAQFAQAMAYDFNFAHDLVPGAQFRAVYERQEDTAGNPIGRPRLVMAQLNVQAFRDEFRKVDEPAKARKFYLFDPLADGHPAWFSDTGVGAVRDLMRMPVDGARVTSPFGFRNHPILERVIFHKGVDLACPIGTPVYAAADGVVIRATDPPHSGGYGNFLNIRHNEHMVTCYAHNSRFADGIAVGVKVTQGQTVAWSGNTGNSTGPHLHFEIRMDDQPVDPLSFKTNTTRALEGDQLAKFRIARDHIDSAGEGCV